MLPKRSHYAYTNRYLQAEETSPNSRYPAKSVLLSAICLSKRVILYCNCNIIKNINFISANRYLPSVLITGCSSGHGEALAKLFVKNEYPTYASARRIESIEHLKKIGCETLQIDVTSYDSIDKAVKTIEKKHSSVGILINNAANGIMGAMETIPLEDVKRLYETNVFGLLAMTQAVLPKMRKAGKGRIVNIGSSGGEFSFLLGSSKVIIKTTLPPHQILSYQCSPKTLQHPHQPEKNASVA